MEDQHTQYVRNQLSLNVLPSQIVDNLVASGWNPQQATALVQQISGVQLAVAAAPGPGGYTKPPLILRILYVLSFLALIVGILAGVGAVVAFTSISHSTAGSNTDSISRIIAAASAIYAIVLIGYYFVVKDMKNGSLTALKIFTFLQLLPIIISFGLAYYISNNRYRGSSSSLAPSNYSGVFIQNGIPLLITAYIWLRHRSYFR